jgi:hypothetical protein
VVFHDPTENCILKGSPSDWDGLPRDKSLFHSASGCGLPIGNLTSQWFANLYLNELDQFVKRDLGFRYYGRYVDDLLLMHSDRKVLLEAIGSIRQFLSEHLHLILHPRKIRLQPASHGFPFLGAYILPHRTYVGRRTKGNFQRTMTSWREYGKQMEQAGMAWPSNAKESFRSVRDSYTGLLGHFDCQRLIATTLTNHPLTKETPP